MALMCDGYLYVRHLLNGTQRQLSELVNDIFMLKTFLELIRSGVRRSIIQFDSAIAVRKPFAHKIQ